MKTAVIYIRVRDELCKQTALINNQLDACTKYANEKGFTVVDTYIDREILGVPSERKAQAQLLSDSKTQSWDYVIVSSTDRIARDYKYLDKYETTLEKNGKRLLTIGSDENDLSLRRQMNEFIKQRKKEQRKTKVGIYIRFATQAQYDDKPVKGETK